MAFHRKRQLHLRLAPMRLTAILMPCRCSFSLGSIPHFTSLLSCTVFRQHVTIGTLTDTSCSSKWEVSIVALSARNVDTGPGEDIEANLQGILNVFTQSSGLLSPH